jgi:hypothetical protein
MHRLGTQQQAQKPKENRSRCMDDDVCISHSQSLVKMNRHQAVRTARLQSQLDAKYSTYTPAPRAGK